MSDGTTYLPGSGTALVGAGCTLLLAGDASARVPELWPLVRDGADLDAVLEGLVAQGLRALGPFALMHGGRVVLRGAGRAELGGSGVALTGASVTSWAEYAVDGETELTLRLSDEPGEAGASPLPVIAGVVRAAAVTVVRAGGELPPTPVLPLTAAPEPEPEPVPDPVAARLPMPAAAAPAAMPPAAPATAPIPAQAAEPEPDPEPEPQPEPEPISLGWVDAVPVSPDTIAPERTEAPPRNGSALVDSIPDFGAGGAGSAPAADEGYDHLFGQTVHRSPEEAAVRPVEVDDEPALPAAVDTDHDGSTIMRSELPDRGAHRAPAASPAQPGADEVWGVLCPDGHANPPHSPSCRVCGLPLPDADPVPVPRPPLGRLRVSDGSQTVLDRTVLIGRAPSANRYSSTGLPRLLRVVSPQQDISRTHVEVRVEDWNVLVVDLSSNGTRLVRPGAEPQMLHPGEPVLVLPGSVLDLGDGVTVAYEADGS